MYCFEKCGFPTDDYVATSQDSDEELQMFNKISVNCSSDEHIEADNNLATSEVVDVSAVDWREALH